MKSNIRKRALFLLLCLSLFTTASVTRANAVSFYAATLHGVNGHAPSFVFSDGTFAETTFIGNIDSAEPMAVMPCGANCNGTYYGLLAKEGVPYKSVRPLTWYLSQVIIPHFLIWHIAMLRKNCMPH